MSLKCVKKLLFCLCVGVLSSSILGETCITSQDFETTYQKHLIKPVQMKLTVMDPAYHYLYVFVPGFLHRWVPTYFLPNRAHLIRMGIPKDSIKIIRPSHGQSKEKNIEWLFSKFQTLQKIYPHKQMVIMGHSKGASEALALSLQNSVFFKKHVAYLFLIQGVFGGSGVADYVLGQGKPISNQLNFLSGTAMWFMGKAASLVSPMIHPGLESLRRENAQSFWKDIKQKHGHIIEDIQSRVYHFKAHREPSEMSIFLQHTGHYLKNNYGDSDGLVTIGDQDPGFGTHLYTFEVCHGGLILHQPITNVPKRTRMAFNASWVEVINK